MKLISMTDFVLEQKKQICEDYKTITEVFFNRIVDYANFLKQPLTLGMFVPVDKNGNVLKERLRPDKKDYWSDNDSVFSAELYKHNLNEFEEYQKAKDKVLFEFERVNPQDIMDEFSTIEDMANFYEPELTESALKQISLNP